MHLKSMIFTVLISVFTVTSFAQNRNFNGLGMNMSNLYRLSNAESRSISPENFTGEKGKGGMATPDPNAPRNTANASHAARDLGQGWKVNPYVIIQPGETFTMAEIEGPGAIQHIWMTPTGNWRFSIIRIYWDDETEPSVEVPVGHFFGMGWNEYAHLNSLPVTVNPGSAFNCYWNMPFHKKARITMTNINDEQPMSLYYQIDYTLTDVPDDAAYFHAQFRRTKVNTTSVYTIVDGIKGEGHYVGVYMAWQVNNNGWWGEGEIKFFIDGDQQFPTIIGTGTEDYFCGSYGFDRNGKYVTFTTPYAGLVQVLPPELAYKAGQRFGLYRWHIMDPIRFKKDLRITIQDLGWRHGGRYLPQQSDISSAVFWYQAEPHASFPALPSWKELEVN
ncbi:glycoside hydrolase family 172 protein [Anaerophaga thermohalophila]|uniref:glycoside hydrolase family 172 protein n=1 Tax=Anaerophaga thermohalophila TaxID=177400 RepID=UPI000237C68B|nr:glycoside hydrolase family 172 protein [Anaerophaga thermohalophila]